jgi:hypothetical protein
MALNPRTCSYFLLSCSIAVSAISLPASADFFDDARRTFQTDIPHFFQTDFPHFFQDDIPCAFGGQPTSHTKTSCKSASRPARHATDKDRDRGAARPDETPEVQDAQPNSRR